VIWLFPELFFSFILQCASEICNDIISANVVTFFSQQYLGALNVSLSQSLKS
jgi:hypothetical protein